jgi:hypothetical protein
VRPAPVILALPPDGTGTQFAKTNEHRTLNIERPTSNEKQSPIKHSMLEVRCSMFIFSGFSPSPVILSQDSPYVGSGVNKKSPEEAQGFFPGQPLSASVPVRFCWRKGSSLP